MQIIEYFRPYGPLSLSGLSFVYVVLPVFVIIHRLFPARLRPGALLCLSLIYYALVQPASLALMAASVISDYVAVRVMKKKDDAENARRLCMWFSVIKNLAVIISSGFLSRQSGIPPVLGAAVFALSGMSAVIDMYIRESPYELDFIKFSLYCCFFPRLYAGPLVSCEDFCGQLSVPPKRETAVLGVLKFLEGAVKTFVLAGELSAVYTAILAFPTEKASVLSSWVLVLVFALAVYYALSGLGDMAQGIGLIFGINLPHNFYYPYQSRNVMDFFERFNITVGGFVNKYVYKSLGGDKKGFLADSVNTVIMCGLTGLWFGFRLNHLVWGAYLALFILIDKYLLKNIDGIFPTLIRRLLTFCIVLFGFVILLSGDAQQYADNIKYIFGFLNGESFANNAILYVLSSNWVTLAVACFFSTNIMNLLTIRLRKAFPRVFEVLCGFFAAFLLGVFTVLSF